MTERPWLAVVLLTSAVLSGTAAAADPPVIHSFSPQDGPVGTLVRIEGNWFFDQVSVSFAGLPAVQLEPCWAIINQPPAPGCIKASVPLDALTGPITVTTANGSAATATNFEVLAGPGHFTVTEGQDSTVGSLRWCLEQARAHPGFDRIDVLSGYGVGGNCLTTPLAIDHQVAVIGLSYYIYGNFEPNYVGACGTDRVPRVFELKAGSSGSTLQNLKLIGFSESGLVVESESEGNWIQDNWIGFNRVWSCPIRSYCEIIRIDLNRTTDPEARGVTLQSSFNVVRNNTISGVGEGIFIGDPAEAPTGAEYRGNAVMENRVGADPAGTTAASYGNGLNGLTLGAGARENWIGPGNVFSGNSSSGVALLHATNVGNVVFGNHIGVGADGNTLVGNGGWGVVLTGGANGNAVGGAAGHNEISGNAVAGVALGHAGGPATGNWVQDNVIGMNAAQTQSVGGQGMGIVVSNGSQFNVIEGNAIAGNSQHGVCLWNSTSNGINGNWVGQSAYGTQIPNGIYGLCFIDSGFNFVLGNAFGTNGAANVFEWNSPGNVFE